MRTCRGEQTLIIQQDGDVTLAGETMVTTDADDVMASQGQVTLQLDQNVLNNLLLEPETTQIQIGALAVSRILDFPASSSALIWQSRLFRPSATVSRIGLMESCTCRRGGPPPPTLLMPPTQGLPPPA